MYRAFIDAGDILLHEEGKIDGESKPYSWALSTLESFVVGISGLLAARAMTTAVYDLRLGTSAARIVAFTLAGALCLVFAIARTRRPSFANVVLFVATFVIGLAHW